MATGGNYRYMITGGSGNSPVYSNQGGSPVYGDGGVSAERRPSNFESNLKGKPSRTGRQAKGKTRGQKVTQ